MSSIFMRAISIDAARCSSNPFVVLSGIVEQVTLTSLIVGL
jgi:hypothetical protein